MVCEEKQVRLARQQLGHGHFLHAQQHVAGRHILVYFQAEVAVFLVGKGTVGAGLHPHPQAGVGILQLHAFFGGEGHAAVGRGAAFAQQAEEEI